eukprot:3326427-Prymnesium_polylepis.1
MAHTGRRAHTWRAPLLHGLRGLASTRAIHSPSSVSVVCTRRALLAGRPLRAKRRATLPTHRSADHCQGLERIPRDTSLSAHAARLRLLAWSSSSFAVDRPFRVPTRALRCCVSFGRHGPACHVWTRSQREDEVGQFIRIVMVVTSSTGCLIGSGMPSSWDSIPPCPPKHA